MAAVHLDDATLHNLLDLPSVHKVVHEAFIAWGNGQAASTQRVRASAVGITASAMAAVVPPYSGGKVYITKNGVFTFLNVLFDLSGNLLCTLDGDVLTRFRTPALCQVAIDYLSPPVVDVAALVGAGRQGRYHLEMLAVRFPDIEVIRVADVKEESAAALVAHATSLGIRAVVASSPVEAVRGAQVIVTVTPSTTPLFQSNDIDDDALICAVGATKYDRCEIPSELVQRSSAIVCDDVTGAQVECGDLIQAAAIDRFDWSRAIELSDVAAGNVLVDRDSGAPVLFETQGVALQDIAAAGLAWERYQQIERNENA